MTYAVDGFERTTFRALGRVSPVYRRGSGPPVLVMHEVPGITPQVAAFARRVADAGFSVAMPEMFGQTGGGYTVANMGSQLIAACIRREFAVLAKRRSSPITIWLRTLARRLHQEHGGAGVGAIGMCLTGNFALALMVDPWLMAPVLSQPSLPFSLTPAQRRALHLSDEDLATVKRRAEEEGVSVLGLRFSGDLLCPGARFDRLREELWPRFEGIEIDSGRGNPHGIGMTAHSVLARDLVDEEGHPTRAALERVLAFFEEKLKPAG